MTSPEIFRHPCRRWTMLCCAAMVLLPGLAAADAVLTGERIYQRQCAACHGADGQGTDEAGPLAGERSLAELAQVIVETMPEDDPAACIGEDADKVAAYLYESFYSPAAQARNKAARVELSRLTVGQYRNAVADLVGSFTGTGPWDDKRGLRGEYFNNRRFRNDQRAIDRRDPAIDFDFGPSSPEPGKIGTEEFAIRWQGSVLAPETGEYEFIVNTENAFRLWVNDERRPLIDAWVKSGDDTEYHESVRLLGGRTYRLRLEYFKSKKEESASIGLYWKQPRRVAEVIPERNLSPNWSPRSLVIETPFPPDDRSIGYERGTSVSKEWHQASTYAAIEVAGYVAANLSELSGAKEDASDRASRLRDFSHQFTERAFRRPLADEQREFFVDRHFDAASDPELAVKKVVLLVLTSPRFLYREIGSNSPDAYDVASRLAFGLWDSLPDPPLLEAAAGGRLETPDQIARQAERMVSNPRAKAKLREFFHHWLNVEHIHELSKDKDMFPDFDESIVSDLRTSLDLFLDEVLESESADFRQLLLSDSLYLNGRLARFYGVDLPENAPFQKVVLDPQQRAGVLSHPFLLSGFAYYATSSPIHRGVFISRSLLGRSLRPPPEAVSPLSPDLHPDLTTRERTDVQTSPASCQTCHAMINPLGFTLEHFDAAGRYRIEEKGKPIDATGYYHTLAGERVEFQGVRELAAFLAANDETHRAFVEQLFHHLVKQPIRAFGPDRPERLRQAFVESGFHLRQLMVDTMLASAPQGEP